MSILSCVVIFHSCQPVMACWTEIFCWFILNKWIVMFDCICCDSRYLKHNGDEASWRKLGESADLKPHLLSGTWCSWGCRQLLHCERYRCLFYWAQSMAACITIHPVTAAVISAMIKEMPSGSQYHSSQFAHHPLSIRYLPNTEVLVLIASYLLLFWRIWVSLDHYQGSHTGFSGINKVYNGLLTLIMCWWTYLVLKPSKIVHVEYTYSILVLVLSLL